jgi:hypothetical protein
VRHRRATARDWRSYVRAAWRASVGVAMRLGVRFRHNPMVREALAARIVQSGVQKLVVVGDAVTAALQAALEHGSSRKEDVVEQALSALSRRRRRPPHCSCCAAAKASELVAHQVIWNTRIHDQGRDQRRRRRRDFEKKHDSSRRCRWCCARFRTANQCGGPEEHECVLRCHWLSAKSLPEIDELVAVRADG